MFSTMVVNKPIGGAGDGRALPLHDSSADSYTRAATRRDEEPRHRQDEENSSGSNGQKGSEHTHKSNLNEVPGETCRRSGQDDIVGKRPSRETSTKDSDSRANFGKQVEGVAEPRSNRRERNGRGGDQFAQARKIEDRMYGSWGYGEEDDGYYDDNTYVKGYEQEPYGGRPGFANRERHGFQGGRVMGDERRKNNLGPEGGYGQEEGCRPY